MRTDSALFFCLALLYGPVAAEEDRSVYSKGSPALVLKARSDGGQAGHFATFVGRLRLTGTLIVEFDRLPNQSDPEDTEGEAFFVPNAQSRKFLPAAVGVFYAKPVYAIALDKKPKELLQPLLGQQRTRKLLHGSMPRYELPAVLTIKSFSSWVECDHRSYTAEVFSIAPEYTSITAATKSELIGC